MSKNIAFCSICTLNYTAYAATLTDSLIKSGHTQPHYVLIVDHTKDFLKIIKEFKFIPVSIDDLEIPEVKELTKKYDAFELSNVLKPYFMRWLLTHKPEIKYLSYLDTDTYVFSKLDEVFDFLDQNSLFSVVLTPHVINPELLENKNDYFEEHNYFSGGLYNGGFYVLKNDSNSIRFLNWHCQKMRIYGYKASNNHMYVDQKILDFAPIIFDFVGIYRNNRYNIGHWNYVEEQFSVKKNKYFVQNKPLVFFHFSQINYRNEKLFFGYLPIHRKTLLQILINDYLKALDQHHHQEISKIPYGFKNLYRPNLQAYMGPLDIEIERLKQIIESKDKDIAAFTEHLQKSIDKLHQIYDSKGWKILRRLYLIKDKFNFKFFNSFNKYSKNGR